MHEVFYKNNLKDGEEIAYDSIGKVLSLKVFSHDSLVRVVR
jgi:antitoxin component YwqK of YwqJK toxin-antitoxin module